MKNIHTVNKMNEGPVVLKVEDQGHMIELIHSYPHRPSWKTYGEGRDRISLTLHKPSGTLSLNILECPDSCRGAKEVYVSMNKDAVAALAEMLKEVLK